MGVRRGRAIRLALVLFAAMVAGCSPDTGGEAVRPAGSPAATPSGPEQSVRTPSAPPSAASLTPPSSSSAPSSSPAPAPSSQAPSISPAGPPVIGAAGAGDRYYPTSGNGGYQVDSYDVSLRFDPATGLLEATTVVTATVTAHGTLVRFDLDLQPSMRVGRVMVDGRAASYRQQQAELVITPATGLPAASRFSVSVGYHGRPATIPGKGGSPGGGWFSTAQGGALVAGEPLSASAWYPVDEHPSDLAAFALTATVPDRWQVISIGVPAAVQSRPLPGWRSVRWVQQRPVASYLTTIYIGTFATRRGTLTDGRPVISAIAPGPDRAKDASLADRIPEVIKVLSDHFGTFPFDSAGGIFTGEHLGFALETATRPVYPGWVDLDTVVHELSHQWFGDLVAVRRWADICLNECFASYGPWLWHQDTQGADLDAFWTERMSAALRDRSFWASPLVDMGPGAEFTAVYSRGPLALHALRKQMGDKAFATMLRDWPRLHAGQSVTFDEWERYLDRVSGQHLGPFVQAWFRGRVAPPEQFRHPGGLGR